MHFHFAPLREEIYHCDPNAVKPTGGLISLLFEFATEFQNRHHPFERADLSTHFLRKVYVALGRDSTTVVLDRHRPVRIDRYRNGLGVPRHRFIDRIVYHFVNQVMQPFQSRITDIHPRPGSNVLQVIEELQILCVVIGAIQRYCLSLCRGRISFGILFVRCTHLPPVGSI